MAFSRSAISFSVTPALNFMKTTCLIMLLLLSAPPDGGQLPQTNALSDSRTINPLTVTKTLPQLNLKYHPVFLHAEEDAFFRAPRFCLLMVEISYG
jgi:hypothetical protein